MTENISNYFYNFPDYSNYKTFLNYDGKLSNEILIFQRNSLLKQNLYPTFKQLNQAKDNSGTRVRLVINRPKVENTPRTPSTSPIVLQYKKDKTKDHNSNRSKFPKKIKKTY